MGQTILCPFSGSNECLLQDTAGQERFSSLSTAFFRGADAVLMMYDVNTPQSLLGLRKWWREFQERVPVPEEEAADYCCVVVGNKIDLAEEIGDCRNMAVSEEETRILLEELIPTSSASTSPITLQLPHEIPRTEIHSASPKNESPSSSDVPNGCGSAYLDSDDELPKPIDIRFSGRRQSISRPTSRSRLGGTMTTTHTSLSVYHTPSSSLFDEYVSAPSSPMHTATASSRPTRNSLSPGSLWHRGTSASTNTSSVTITPSLFERPASMSTSTPATALPLDRGPKLFLTSAKSGHTVPIVFEYIAKRVISRWEWEDSVQDRAFNLNGNPSEINVVQLPQSKKDTGWASLCCA